MARKRFFRRSRASRRVAPRRRMGRRGSMGSFLSGPIGKIVGTAGYTAVRGYANAQIRKLSPNTFANMSDEIILGGTGLGLTFLRNPMAKRVGNFILDKEATFIGLRIGASIASGQGLSLFGGNTSTSNNGGMAATF